MIYVARRKIKKGGGKFWMPGDVVDLSGVNPTHVERLVHRLRWIDEVPGTAPTSMEPAAPKKRGRPPKAKGAILA